ncbi:DUF6138 family protein [Paenibacillus hexagrammi]|uniref:DUF6138 family protein n=1 Tax=Paenibacillus hexagrammi TaxID=2908839 RepID=A0ABY3SBS0_9BACL|nr:DUF6138 family protein [Paenibacillus sp. YPD9-1]UJF31444.1 DUF6138 family protein [Paenibacillus sp. YPD9-1]
MDANQETLLDEMKRQIDNWMADLNDDHAEKIVKRTPLQAGIHSYALLEYAKGKVSVTDVEPDLTMQEEETGFGEFLSEAQLREQIVPELASYTKDILMAMLPGVIDYKYTLSGSFHTTDGWVHVRILEYVDETKREQLLARISNYIAVKLEVGKYPTKPLESFFLARHLLDKGLFPEADSSWIIAVFESIQQVNKGNKHLAEHRGYLIGALRSWVESQWLPAYYDNIGTAWQKEYKKKAMPS